MEKEAELHVNGVSLREYIELLVDAKTNEIKVVMAERLAAVQTAYQQHDGDHKIIEKDMEHLNQLRTEVTTDRGLLVPLTAYNTYKEGVDRWMSMMGNNIASLRGQIVGAGAVLTIGLVITQVAVAYFSNR